ncbi:unnamed protein product [Schistocephalus solidus]|uniref:Secreted protein n=1 Tax=Schistocephalus solidus TaxID=70667 RepID=A0A183THX9_SCHSO|nr:unnamed protein product [Schistocephalus solidus]
MGHAMWWPTHGRDPQLLICKSLLGIDLAEMAAEQCRVCSSWAEDVSGLQLPDLPLTNGNATTLCDVSTTTTSTTATSSHPCTIFLTLGVELPIS